MTPADRPVPEAPPSADVLRCADAAATGLSGVVARFGLRLRAVEVHEAVPGSYWGESEAGLVASDLWVRSDTPLHSALHEACHFVCMDTSRRRGLDTDAGGDYEEENGVCYLQILLADHLDGFGRSRMFADMDAWGYSFRLGSARAWFENDAADARQWLGRHGLIDSGERVSWCLRE